MTTRWSPFVERQVVEVAEGYSADEVRRLSEDICFALDSLYEMPVWVAADVDYIKGEAARLRTLLAR